MIYKLWNKKDDIKNVSADYWINSLNIQDSDGVFIILKNDNVERVEIDRIIKSNFNLDANLTTEQVAQEYIRIHKEMEENAQKEQISLEDKISNLETENTELRKELTITQDAVNELILSSMSL